MLNKRTERDYRQARELEENDYIRQAKYVVEDLPRDKMAANLRDKGP